MVAVSVNFFLAPARIPDVTMLSLGMVAQYLFGLPVVAALLLLRTSNLFFGCRYLGRWPSLLGMGYTALVITIAIDFTAVGFAPASANSIWNVLYGGSLSGLGMGLIFQGRGNTGGAGSHLNRIRFSPSASKGSPVYASI